MAEADGPPNVTSFIGAGTGNPSSTTVAPSVTAGTALSGLLPVPQTDPVQQQADLITAGEQYKSKNAALAAQAAGLGGDGGAAGAAIAKGIADKTVSDINEAAAMKQQQDDMTAAVALGMQPGGDNLVSQMGIKMRDAEAQLLDLHDKIVAKRSLSFMDNPLQWISNQISTPYDIDEYNTRAEGINQMSSVTKELSTMFDDQHRIDMAIDTGAGAARMKAQGDSIMAGAGIVAGQMTMEANKVGLMQVQALGQLAEGDLRGAQSTNQAINANLTEAQRANYATVQQQLAGIALQSATLSEDQRNTLQARIDLYNNKFNIPIDQRLTAADYLKMDIPNRVEFGKLLASATANPLDPNGAQAGENVLDAVNNVTKFGVPMGTAGNVLIDTMQKMISNTTNTVAQQHIATWGLLDPNAKKGLVNDALAPQINSMLQNSTGIYGPTTLKTLFTDNPAAAQTEIGKVMVQLAASNPNLKLSGDLMTQTVLNAIEGGMPINQAVQQATTITQSMQLKLDNIYNYKRIALPSSVNDDGTLKPYRMQTANMYQTNNGTHSMPDYANPVAYQAFIMRELAAKRMVQNQELSVPDPTNPGRSIINRTQLINSGIGAAP